MTVTTIDHKTQPSSPTRHPWETPAIVLERSLEASAQGGPPVPPGAPPSFLGPLGVSGDTGQCKT